MFKILGFFVFLAGALIGISASLMLWYIDGVNGLKPLFETWNQFSAFAAIGLFSLALMFVGFLMMRGDPTGEP